jgi:colanic acid biosynthesis glycosyl transferase WcaI
MKVSADGGGQTGAPAPAAQGQRVRIIFINRFFYPDHSGTSQMLSDLAFALADRGLNLEIITSRLRYDGPGDVFLPREVIRGVTVHRVWTSRFGRQNLIGRAVDYLTFYLTAARMLWRLARRGDIVVAKTDPPMLSVLAWPLVRLRGAKLVNWLQDVFPEIAERFGKSTAVSRISFRVMRALRDQTLKHADMNVTVGEHMAEHVRSLGVAKGRIAMIPNWTDGAFVRPVARAGNSLRQAWGLGDDFVVGYSGNLGRAHDIETFLAAMTAVRLDWDAKNARGETPTWVRWLFIGGGALVEDLQTQLAARGMDGVAFRPYAPREDLALSLSAADVHLVSLRPEMEGLVVPSKIYGIAAAGRPAIFIGAADGEIARVIARYGFGRTVAQGDGQGLAAAIMELSQQPELCQGMGERARRAFEMDFDKPTAADRWQRLLVEVAAKR